MKFKDIFTLSKNKKKKNKKVDSNASSPLSFSTPMHVFDNALSQWETDNDRSAPLWLSYDSNQQAKLALVEIRRRYLIDSVQTMGSAIAIGGQDRHRMISSILQMRHDSNLQNIAFKSVYSWWKSSTKLEKDALVPIVFSDHNQALAAKRMLEKCFSMIDVVPSGASLILKAGDIRHFIQMYQKQNSA